MQDELQDFDLPAEDKDEFIKIAIRTHFSYFFMPFSKVLVILLFLIIFILIFGFGNLSIIIFILCLSVAIYVIYKEYFIWKNRVYLITNKRVICIYQKNFFDRKVTELNFNKILSTDYEIKGFIQHMLNFGNVGLRIADSSQEILLKNISDPYKIQEYIIKLKNQKKNPSKNAPKKSKNYLIR